MREREIEREERDREREGRGDLSIHVNCKEFPKENVSSIVVSSYLCIGTIPVFSALMLRGM